MHDDSILHPSGSSISLPSITILIFGSFFNEPFLAEAIKSFNMTNAVLFFRVIKIAPDDRWSNSFDALDLKDLNSLILPQSRYVFVISIFRLSR